MALTDGILAYWNLNNDVVMEYTNSSFPTKPTEIIFKQNGTPVYYLALTYDANGAVTRVAQD